MANTVIQGYWSPSLAASGRTWTPLDSSHKIPPPISSLSLWHKTRLIALRLWQMKTLRKRLLRLFAACMARILLSQTTCMYPDGTPILCTEEHTGKQAQTLQTSKKSSCANGTVIVTGPLVSLSNTTSTWRPPLKGYGLLVKPCLAITLVSSR